MTRRLLIAAAAFLFAVASAGCKNPCVELAEKLCACESTTSNEDQCNATASNEASKIELTDDDEARCEERVDKGDCNQLDTAEGKVNCGLARP